MSNINEVWNSTQRGNWLFFHPDQKLIIRNYTGIGTHGKEWVLLIGPSWSFLLAGRYYCCMHTGTRYSSPFASNTVCPNHSVEKVVSWLHLLELLSLLLTPSADGMTSYLVQIGAISLNQPVRFLATFGYAFPEIGCSTGNAWCVVIVSRGSAE